MFWQGPLGKGAKHPVPVSSPAVSVMKSLRRGPNGSLLGSSKMSDRVPTGIGPELLPGSSRPVIKARSKLNETTGPLSVPVETTGFPSVRSLIEIVTALTPALALRTTARTATKSAIKTALNNSFCVICPPGAEILDLSEPKIAPSPIVWLSNTFTQSSVHSTPQDTEQPGCQPTVALLIQEDVGIRELGRVDFGKPIDDRGVAGGPCRSSPEAK